MSIRKLVKVGELPEEKQRELTYNVLKQAQEESGREGYLAEEVRFLLNTIKPPTWRFSLTQTYVNLYRLEKENKVVSKYVGSESHPGENKIDRLIFSVVKK